MSRRGRWWLLPGVVWLLTGAARPLAAQSIPVTVGGAPSSMAGVPFDLPIMIDMRARTELLGSFQLEVQWNPAVLELVGGHEVDFGHITVNDSLLGEGRLVASGANPGGVGGLITVAMAQFLPLVDDTTTFTVTVGELYAAGTFADLTGFALPGAKAYCPAGGHLGDVDRDGAANGRDALIALHASIGLDVSGYDLTLADVDASGVTDTRDALIILSYAVGLDVSPYPVFQLVSGGCVTGARASFTLAPGDVTVSPGQEIFFTALAQDSAGLLVAAQDVVWTSSDDQVVAITSDGIATAGVIGTAVVRAVESAGDTAAATVTVTDQRRVYWVDAFAANAVNRLGDANYPFGSLQEAVDFSGPGDTVRVRPATYREYTLVDHGIVIEGDTSLGGLRPLLGVGEPYVPAIEIDAAGRVELSNFRVDTLYQPVSVLAADTVLVRNVEFRTAPFGFASIAVDSVGALLIQGSRFYGPPTWQAYTSGVSVTRAGLVQIEATVIADFGGDAVELYDVDSLDIRASTFRDNYGSGVWAYCSACTTADSTTGIAAVLHDNRMLRNLAGQVVLDGYRSAEFARNQFLDRGDANYADAVTLYGHLGSRAAFHADSFDLSWGAWLIAADYDSLSVDSAAVVSGMSQGGLYYGRRTVIRDARFLGLEGGAFRVDGAGYADATLAMERVAFLGPDSSVCDLCGGGVDAFNVTVVADGITAYNLYSPFYLSTADFTLSNASLTHTEYAIDSYCSTTRLTNVTADDSYMIASHDGCVPEDSLVIRNSRFASAYYGVYSYYADVLIEGSSFLGTDWGVEAGCGDITLRNDTLSSGSTGLYAYGCWDGTQYTDTVTVDSVWVEGMADYGLFVSGVDTAAVRRSTFVNSAYGVDFQDGRIAVADNVLSGITGQGIRAFSGGYGSFAVERNQVTCTSGAMGIVAVADLPDTAIVRDNVVSSCTDGIYAYGPVVEVRANDVTMRPDRAGVNGIEARGDTALRVVGNTVTGVARSGSIDVFSSRRADVDSNTVSGSAGAGLYVATVDSLFARYNAFTAHDTTFSSGVGEQPGAIVLGATSTTRPGAAVLRGNRIEGSAANGIVLQRPSGDTVTVIVDSNSVQGATLNGMYLYGYPRALITRNAIDGTIGTGVRIDRFVQNEPTAVVLANNNLTNSGGYGILNLDGASAQYDARNNWWGDALGPSGAFGDTTGTSTGDSVSANLVWDPWLTAPQGDAPVPVPPALVPLVASSALPAPVVVPWRTREPAAHRTQPTPRARETAPREPAVTLDRFVASGASETVRTLARARAAAATAAAVRLAEWEAQRAARVARETERARIRAEREAERAERRASAPPPDGGQQ